MGKEARSLWLGIFLVFLASAASGVIDGLNIWPMPKSVSHGRQTLYLSKNFGLETEGTKYDDISGILGDGFSRLLDEVDGDHVVDTNATYPSLLIKGLHVVISSEGDQLQLDTDESYKLSIPSSGSPIYAHIKAETVYGALHGLQTFSQLCHFNFTNRIVEVHQAPWSIFDQPRFSYRGLLIDGCH